jgi:hypothetical protein
MTPATAATPMPIKNIIVIAEPGSAIVAGRRSTDGMPFSVARRIRIVLRRRSPDELSARRGNRGDDPLASGAVCSCRIAAGVASVSNHP